VVSDVGYTGLCEIQAEITTLTSTNLTYFVTPDNRNANATVLFDGDLTNGTNNSKDIEWLNTTATLGTKLFKITSLNKITQFILSSQFTSTVPGWKIIENGIEVYKDAVNRGSSTVGTTETYDLQYSDFDININESGTYRAEIKAVSSYTFTEKVTVADIIVRDGSSQFKPGVSAKDIKHITGTTTSGLYWISINDVPTQLYCDMSSIDGGGWTLIGKSNGTFNDPNNWLKASVGGMMDLNNSESHACIDARELVASQSTECTISSTDLSKWIRCDFHTECTKDTIFNHGAGHTKIHSDALANSQLVTATAWNGSTQDCYVNVYSVMAAEGHAGSTPTWSKNENGNTSGDDYAIGVSCATSSHNGFPGSNPHNGMDAPYNDTWPNPIYGQQGFKGFIWVR